MIPYGKQDLNENDLQAVLNVLNSDFLTQGPQVPLFEKSISIYCGSNFAIASNSATSSLHIACKALGLCEGDYLWTSPNSFVASANCGLYCNARIDFVDIDPNTYNLSVDELEKKLVKAKRDKKLPKILVPVHFAGQSCDMAKIKDLSDEYGFYIIEDASHSIGAKYNDFSVGCCQYSDITVFSFHPVKIITTAEGGVATTNSKSLAKRMRLFNSHGITRDQEMMIKPQNNAFYYQQILLGFNYRMTELQAALGTSQLERVDEFVTRRHLLKKRYDRNLIGLPIELPYQSKFCYSSLHLYPIKIRRDNNSKNRDIIFDKLRENDIGVNVHYIPIHTHPYYQDLGFKYGDFPQAENYYENALSLPLFPSMTFDQQDYIINTLHEILK
ncbi:UDP-4-amino-4,6-dideoxy-N-acetyl-beta-L-altrosamine transaminase [Candidatus Thioglobus sp.]|nr:UDP-4-amino-4,6-dideoxy-N-acetyl-beta-L-altrosamine transaminase [Candidatus Thioglobus sp.]